MFSHDRIWAAIDALAERHSLSVSGLAKRAGLDPTTFNKSKRYAVDGRARWPSTESFAKIMEATGASLDEFMMLVAGKATRAGGARRVPSRCSASPRPAQAASLMMAAFLWVRAGMSSSFRSVPVMRSMRSKCRAIPCCRFIVTVIRLSLHLARQSGAATAWWCSTKDGEVMAKILARQTPRTIELQSMNPEHPNRTFDAVHIDWIARILWASQ